MKPVNVGLLGLGTVGGGTISVLNRNAEEITGRAGRAIQVTHASARDLNKQREFSTAGITLCQDPFEVVNNPDIDIVAELIGGIEPARELVLKAIANDKHVVTANKALIALHGNEIFRAAQNQGVMVAFEAAVAGGIPIIKAIREGLSANRIEQVAGIINGTSNFILTEMRERGLQFDAVLDEAKELGYAEADPSFDIEGTDAAHKLTILAAIAFGIPLQYDKVHTEGITDITPADVDYAGELGYRIKHLGIARRTDHGIETRVHPTLVPRKRLMANVEGVMNAVLVKGDAVGPTIYYGAGAGAEPTASAVVADLVDVTRALTSDPENRVPHLAFQPDALNDGGVLAVEDNETAYYLRMSAIDQPGVLAEITRILGERDISIEAFLQKEQEPDTTHVPIILLTQKVREGNMNAAIEAIEKLPVVSGRIMRIRVETLA
ncbi:homoserine dehydrogenase [Methylohalomonas lacus]|uniref:Homoserine dehydrogenase n=1 Tax=Methylohalomonas lacus TaxID=398773 RepID=A0AAE3HNF6_9GAMM|nr:homoserine dehydrogenase [Methylohalomonas lacus]MCS3904546.1 homoserine dehydrogenase [Methylohalomonas lacus]